MIVLLHHRDADAALDRLAPEPDEVWTWVSWVRLHRYAALRAEASVLAGHLRAADRIAAARTLVTGNPIAAARLDRARALLDGDLPRLLATAEALTAADRPYQCARTLLLAGSPHTAAVTTALTTLGLTPVPLHHPYRAATRTAQPPVTRSHP